MSIRAMTLALDFAKPHWSSSTQLVAVKIADYVDTKWECWPSIPLIAEKTRLSERRVQQIIRELERDGTLTRTARFRGGRQISNLYRWTLNLGIEVALNPANVPVQNPVGNMGISGDSYTQG